MYTGSEMLTDGEYMAEYFWQYANAHGEERADEEWISSPFDTWHKNPHYTGAPGRHPEEDYEDE